MFTGIVEELGTVAARDGGPVPLRLPRGARRRRARAPRSPSTACCLTVVACDAAAGWWEADAVDETLARTNLGDLAPGDPVNLERPVRLADRLGGHLVQGHVDGVGTSPAPRPTCEVSLPDGLGRYVVEKGSITVDGVSLTVVDAASRRASRSRSSRTRRRSRRSGAGGPATASTSRSTSPPSTSSACSPGRIG